jgi:hypothetical protein
VTIEDLEADHGRGIHLMCKRPARSARGAARSDSRGS